jgi:hypothetical protein
MAADPQGTAEPLSPPAAERTPPASPPAAAPAPLPPAPAATVTAQAVPEGQWVFTDQYGWVWMPYGARYTHAPNDGDVPPYMYVYEPAVGWGWVVAPWVWGWGPSPYFGIYGGLRFSWWGHGWGPGWHGYRPGPFRGGFPYHHGFGHRR